MKDCNIVGVVAAASHDTNEENEEEKNEKPDILTATIPGSTKKKTSISSAALKDNTSSITSTVNNSFTGNMCENATRCNVVSFGKEKRRYIAYRGEWLFYNEKAEKFVSAVNDLAVERSDGETVNTFLKSALIAKLKAPMSETEVLEQRHRHGQNQLLIEKRTFSHFLILEVFAPFYLLQADAIYTWVCFGGWFVIAFLLIQLFYCAMLRTWKVYNAANDVRQLASRMQPTARVLRRNENLPGRHVEEYQIPTCQLVPGDIIIVERDTEFFPCDAVVVSGTALVNESSLTGEPLAVSKSAITMTKGEENCENATVDAKLHGKRHFIFAGCSVKERNTDEGKDARTCAVVVHTGSSTARAQLLMDVLYPESKHVQEETHDDGGSGDEKNDGNSKTKTDTAATSPSSSKVDISAFDREMAIALGICIPLTSVFLVAKIVGRHLGGIDMFIQGRFILHILCWIVQIHMQFSPMLLVGLSDAQLKCCEKLKNGLFAVNSLNPQKLLTAARMRILCCDKTGTLTESGLQMAGCTEGEKHSALFEIARSACHSVKRVKSKIVPTGDGNTTVDCGTPTSSSSPSSELRGNAVECELVNASAFEFHEEDLIIGESNEKKQIYHHKEESDSNNVAFETIRTFEFDQTTQRQTVVVRILDEKTKTERGCTSQFTLITKGSPEAIAKMTNDAEVSELAKAFSKEGLYILAFCAKELDGEVFKTEEDVFSKSRESLEENSVTNANKTDPFFLGFVWFENKLRKCTASAISELKHGGIKPLIITGDSELTGAYVAQECGIIEKQQIVLAGKVSKETGEISFSRLHLGQRARDSVRLSERTGSKRGSKSSAIIPVDECMIPLIKKFSSKCSSICPHDKEEFSLEEIGSKKPEHLARFSFILNKATFDALTSPSHLDFFEKTILPHSKVFGRVTPEDKIRIVKFYQKTQPLPVGMVGDGGNDCGALAVADTALALSTCDASLIAPFSSGKNHSIFAFVRLIANGRACFINSVSCFLYAAIYGQTNAFIWWIIPKRDPAEISEAYCFLFICLNASLVFAITSANARGSETEFEGIENTDEKKEQEVSTGDVPAKNSFEAIKFAVKDIFAKPWKYANQKFGYKSKKSRHLLPYIPPQRVMSSATALEFLFGIFRACILALLQKALAFAWFFETSELDWFQPLSDLAEGTDMVANFYRRINWETYQMVFFIFFKLSGRQVETGKKPIFLVKKSKKCQKTAILGQKTVKNEISDLATRKFEYLESRQLERFRL